MWAKPHGPIPQHFPVHGQSPATISLTNYPNKCWACCLNRHSTPPEYSNTLANQQLIWNDHFLKPLCWHSYVCVNREGFGWPCKNDWPERDDFTPKEYLFLVFHSSSKSADDVVQFAQVIFSEHLTHLNNNISKICAPCWETVHRQLINKV